MAAIHDLLAQVQDEALRARLEQEINRLTKTKKFGLVFEEHLPECTPLYDIPVKRGSTVAKKTGAVSEMYEVSAIKDGIATCYHKVTAQMEEIPVDELVSVAQFGEPIYPYLKPIDSVCNAPDSDLWHTLIEADNYHALQLLEYLYAGKVDCIYIDPPYNTGAKDWKYNNDYVDGADAYRHSKWLSMMKKRLGLAKKLLNPSNSVLIVTIDEKEYLHLGCLLEEMFSDARMQMISSVISFKGSSRKYQFTRLDEYIYILEFGDAMVNRLPLSDEWRINPDDKRATHLTWKYLIRSGGAGLREKSPGNFYPIFFTNEGKYFGVGDPLPLDKDRNSIVPPEGTFAVFPVDTQGREHYWNINKEKFLDYKSKGYIKFGRRTPNGVPVMFLTSGEIKKVEDGVYKIDGYDENGTIISEDEVRDIMPGTQWRVTTHDATRHGTDLLSKILPDRSFPYPKSLYAVHDVINFFVTDKPDALIVDFFAGSGTTLHAVNLLNKEDGGHRRCISVTNNEVSSSEQEGLKKQGLFPGDPDWEKYGIARYITWPRTCCTILGKDSLGNDIKGDYYSFGREEAFHMSDGFESNVMYYKLGFLDKTSVALGRQLAELFPLLWLKAGAHGQCPQMKDEKTKMMVLPQNHFAILMDEKSFPDFDNAIKNHQEIQTIYIVTDSEAGYREMIAGYGEKDTYQLYRDYLDNFRINTGR